MCVCVCLLHEDLGIGLVIVDTMIAQWAKYLAFYWVLLDRGLDVHSTDYCFQQKGQKDGEASK